MCGADCCSFGWGGNVMAKIILNVDSLNKVLGALG